MRCIKERYEHLIEINKSKFYGIIYPISSVDEAKDYIKEVQKDYPKATHYCYAYRVNNLDKSNDDGEPSGTAGRPILECLKNNELENILCVVVRYFGGIKLGAGGLIRAYVDATKEALDVANIYEVVEQDVYDITISYSHYEIVKNYLEKKEGQIIDTRFDVEVTITYSTLNFDEQEITNLVNGMAKILLKGQEKVYIRVDRKLR